MKRISYSFVKWNLLARVNASGLALVALRGKPDKHETRTLVSKQVNTQLNIRQVVL